MTITDQGVREAVEVTARERAAVERGRARAYHNGFQVGRRGWWYYGVPLQWGVYGEAWEKGRAAGEGERLRSLYGGKR